MALLEKNESDAWKFLFLAEGETPQDVKFHIGPLVVPAEVWRVRRSELIRRQYDHGWELGIWADAAGDLELITRDIDDFSVVAIRFEEYSEVEAKRIGRLLRERVNYRGELRAIGNVPPEARAALRQAGFDAFHEVEASHVAKVFHAEVRKTQSSVSRLINYRPNLAAA